MLFEENEEIFEEIEGGEEVFEDTQSEKEYLEGLIADSEARLQELSEEDMEDVDGGATVYKAPIHRYLSANAYSYFYRVMLSNCPGSVTGFTRQRNVKSYTKKGSTYWVYRSTLGKCQFTITSKKANGQVYYNHFTVNFK